MLLRQESRKTKQDKLKQKKGINVNESINQLNRKQNEKLMNKNSKKIPCILKRQI